MKLLIKKLCAIILLPFLFISTASAGFFSKEGPTYVDGDGFAIKGYDTVAYFIENKPVKGSENFKYEWNHGVWLFANQKNLDSFKDTPEKYAPQYGGWCAYAAAQDSFAKIDPTQFTILNEKLYLNFNASINKRWTGNRDQFIVDADSNWPGLLKEAKENIK
jgi:YHS domain-containing protein